jgi:hypothetical protein
MQHMTKDIPTTKITKATKGSDNFAHKLRALRDLRGQICFFFFGCGSAALGWLGGTSRGPLPHIKLEATDD